MAAGTCIFSGSVTDFTHQLPLTSRSVQGNKSFQLSDKAAKYMSVTVSVKPKRKKNRKNKNLHKAAKIPQTIPAKKKKIVTLEEPDFVPIRF